MKTFLSLKLGSRSKRLITSSVALLLGVLSANAYPPALHHTFYGMVRDEYGNPLNAAADVYLRTDSGGLTSTKVISNLEPGVNYRLAVPMDAGLTEDIYKPTALRPTVPFKLKVKIGEVFYLPIEMSGDFTQITLPGESTHLNLTLGVDSDGDGLPDSWERALLALRGRGGSLADVNPNDDSEGDGLSNVNEYLAGAYAFDSKSGFALKLAGISGGVAALDFTVVRGRGYSVQASSDFVTWQPVHFRVAGAPSTQQPQQLYQAHDTRPLRVEIVLPEGQEVPQFFRLMLQ